MYEDTVVFVVKYALDLLLDPMIIYEGRFTLTACIYTGLLCALYACVMLLLKVVSVPSWG